MGHVNILMEEIVQVLEEIEWEEIEPLAGIQKIKSLVDNFLEEGGTV